MKSSHSVRCLSDYEGNIINGMDLKTKKVISSRDAGVELLRIAAMFMVITLHYMDKGGLLADWNEGVKGSANIYWLLESAALCCVNVYVIISGYYSFRSRFSIRKLIILWLQVLAYSVGIAVIFFAAAFINGDEAFLTQWKNLYNLQFLALPVSNGHYWFAGSFIMLYILTPVLNASMDKLDKKTHGIVVLLMLGVFSAVKSMLPYVLPIDDRGNGLVWFITLYVTAAYIGRYGMSFIKGKAVTAVCYILSVLGIFISYPIYVSLGKYVGDEVYPVQIPSAYNYIFVFTAAVSLFLFFKDIDIKNTVIRKIIFAVSPCVFGVYLLHEHLFLRYEWPKFFGVSADEGLLGALLRYAGVSILIFTAGVLLDRLRIIVFDICEKIYLSKKEAFDYLITGGLTTVLNWVVYIVCAHAVLLYLVPAEKVRESIANFIAWVAAVIFAYITNRIFVFHSDKTGFGPVMKEFAAFTSARVISFVIEQVLFVAALYIMDDIVAKLLIGIIVVILNYVFSKLWIFKKTPTEKKDV